MRLLLTLLLPLLALSTAAEARTLTLAETIATALRLHPSLQSAEAQRDVARARIGEVYASYLPSLSVSALGRGDYSNFTPVIAGTAGSAQLTFPFSPSFRYSASLNLQQTIYDFGRTAGRVLSAREALEQATADREALRQTVALGAVNAYLGVLQAIALRKVALEALGQMEGHVTHAAALYKAGVKPEVDVLAANTQRAQARLQVVRAENGVETAKVTLNGAMGVEAAGDYDVLELALGPVDGESGALEPLVIEAAKRRPEFESVRRQVESARAQVRAARGDYFPLLSLSTGALATGNSPPQGATDSSSWGPFYDFSGQVNLSLPIFTGLSTRRLVQEDEALVRAALAQGDALRQNTRLTVATARIGVQEAREALTAAQVVRAEAEAQLRSAEGRYRAGVGTFVELADAQSVAVSARAQEVQARYTLSGSRATLLRQLGRPMATR